MSRREIPYPNAALALEMVENGYTPREAAEAAHVSRGTVYDIRGKVGHWAVSTQKPVFIKWREAVKRRLEAALGEIQINLLQHVAETYEKSSPYQAAGMFGIMFDKARLLAGESTSNVEIRSTVELVGLDKLAERLGQRLLPEGQPEK